MKLTAGSLILRSEKRQDITDLAEVAVRFRLQLEKIKSLNSSADFGWYPYDTFSAFPVLSRMLREERRNLLAIAGMAPILDIGCGDGDLSFFFESLGCRVTAIDHPETNYNRTLGFRALEEALASSVILELRNVDDGLDLRGHTYGLAVCLGVLYHLKNPFSVLEKLARRARYCILSTRIAQVTARGTRIADEPVAYLLDRTEANHDDTNYWIFSETGLRRIIDRTGWDLCDYSTAGVQHGSDPTHDDRDQRAFCMLRSKLPDPWLDCELEGGWHDMEDGNWRWTEKVFTVRVARKSSERGTLRFCFTLPEAVVQSVGPIRLRAAVAGAYLPYSEYRVPGNHVYVQELPSETLAGDSIPVRFELDQAYAPDGTDRRQLGVQVIFWSCADGAPRMLHPISIGQSTP